MLFGNMVARLGVFLDKLLHVAKMITLCEASGISDYSPLSFSPTVCQSCTQTHTLHIYNACRYTLKHVRLEFILRQRYRNTFWVGVCNTYSSIVWGELSLNYAIQRQVSVTKCKEDSRCSGEHLEVTYVRERDAASNALGTPPARHHTEACVKSIQ